MDINQSPSTTEPTASSTPPASQPTSVRNAGAPGGLPERNGLAIASFVIGIVSLILGFTFFGFILGILAIVFGVISLKKVSSKTFPIIGIVTGAIGTLVSVIVTIIAITALVIGGAAINEASTEMNQIAEERQALVDAKKDFAAGETATFANFEVKVDKVTRNYVPENEFQRASDGKELIVVSLSTKNTSDEAKYISAFDFEVVANGVGEAASYIDVEPAYEGGDVEPDGTASGNIVFEVPAGATGLKLQYTTYESGEELTYSIAL